MARKNRQIEAKKGGDAWLMTYGDMMSLLLTFFVLIVSFSSIQEAKFQEAAASLRAAFGVLMQQPSVINMNQPIIPRAFEKQREDILTEVRKLEQVLLDLQMDRQVDVTVSDQGVTLRIASSQLFDSGKADLKPQTRTVLETLGQFLRKFPNTVWVEGHTDSVPIRNDRFPSNWELSAGRAAAVARFFEGSGVDPQRLAAVGYGEYRPLASNETEEGRARNRRVEIFLEMDGDQPLPADLPLADEESEDG
jgi:chemotaxis protein MotB